MLRAYIWFYGGRARINQDQSQAVKGSTNREYGYYEWEDNHFKSRIYGCKCDKYKIYKSNYVKIVYNVYMLIVEIGVFYMKKVLEILEVVVTLSLLTKLIYFINYYDNLI